MQHSSGFPGVTGGAHAVLFPAAMLLHPLKSMTKIHSQVHFPTDYFTLAETFFPSPESNIKNWDLLKAGQRSCDESKLQGHAGSPATHLLTAVAGEFRAVLISSCARPFGQLLEMDVNVTNRKFLKSVYLMTYTCKCVNDWGGM